MKNIMQMKDLIVLDKEKTIEKDEYDFFIEKDLSEEELNKEEKDYQELCLTSLTVCCTCD